MGYFIHTLLHFLVGACLAYVVLNKEFTSRVNCIVLLIIGGFAGVSPDITKFFGDILGHTLWFVPLFGILIALVARISLRGISLKKLWLIFSIAVFSHILIDFIGNGVAFLYPFVQKEFDFHIIHRNDYFILYTVTDNS